jgi:hypothetical protein
MGKALFFKCKSGIHVKCSGLESTNINHGSRPPGETGRAVIIRKQIKEILVMGFM